MIVGRLAPSPTGALHIGNARTFLWAWLSAKKAGGRVILRVEDLEKMAQGLVLEEMLSDLKWLGLDWDEGPRWDSREEKELEDFPATGIKPVYGETGPSGPYVQSERKESYRKIFFTMKQKGLIYPCGCTKADYNSPVSAPHEGESASRYPGWCRDRVPETEQIRVWRFRVPEETVEFHDRLYGPQSYDIHRLSGDFPVFRTPDLPYYQLAVVADDGAMGITEVVRGDDLLESTARQVLLYQALGYPVPTFGHVPLIVGPDGKRIAKRHGDSKIRTLRTLGMKPGRLVSLLARWSGLSAPDECSPRDLLELWNWDDRPRERIVLTPEKLASLK